MNIHIYRAKDQPATRYGVTLDMPSGARTVWVKCAARRTLPCKSCKQYRWAANLVAHVYYDDTYFSCRKGKGCKGGRRS